MTRAKLGAETCLIGLDLTKSGCLAKDSLDVTGPKTPAIVSVITRHRVPLPTDITVNCLFVGSGKFIINPDLSCEIDLV